MTEQEKLNIVMDTSQYDMFRLCEARFDYRYNQNKSLPIKAKQLDRGTLVHLAQETYWNSLKSGAKWDYAVSSAMLKVKEAGVIESDLDAVEIRLILDVMEQNFDYWKVDDQNLEIVHVEQPFLYLLAETDLFRLFMAGKIDLITNDDKYTGLPTDHKSFDRSYEVGRLGNQFKNYCTATKSYFLRVNKIGFQKTLKPEQKFLRPIVSYDPAILEDWKNNVVKVIHHYVDCVLSNSWPMNETSCDKWNRRCEYYEVCDSSGQEAKRFKLDSNYITIDPWDVTKALTSTSELIQIQKKE